MVRVDIAMAQHPLFEDAGWSIETARHERRQGSRLEPRDELGCKRLSEMHGERSVAVIRFADKPKHTATWDSWMQESGLRFALTPRRSSSADLHDDLCDVSRGGSFGSLVRLWALGVRHALAPVMCWSARRRTPEAASASTSSGPPSPLPSALHGAGHMDRVDPYHEAQPLVRHV